MDNRKSCSSFSSHGQQATSLSLHIAPTDNVRQDSESGGGDCNFNWLEMSSDNFRLLKTEDEEGGTYNKRTASYSTYSDPGAIQEPVVLNEASSLSCYINLTNTIIGSGMFDISCFLKKKLFG